MKVEFYGFERKLQHKKWYTGYVGIKVFNDRFLGFSIYHDQVVIDIDNLKSKPSIGIWLFIFFYTICIDIKDPWK